MLGWYAVPIPTWGTCLRSGKNILGRHFSIWVPNYWLWDRTYCRVANMA